MRAAEIFEQDKARCALDAIFHYNYKPSLGEIYNPWRIFAIDEEGGVIMCEWPEGTLKPAIPLTYAQECMDGMQYQTASHMIWEGMLEQGETIVKAVREKYRGDKQKPLVRDRMRKLLCPLHGQLCASAFLQRLYL